MASGEDERTDVYNTTETDDAESQTGELDSSPQYHPSKKPRRRTTSEVWKHFTKIGIVDGKEKASCNVCGKLYTVGGRDYGTSTLWRHLQANKCVSLPKYKDIGTMMVDQSRNVRARQIDHNKVRELITMAIIKHDLPYSFVEYDGIRDLLEYLNPDYQPITRQTALLDVWNFYLSQKDILKKMIAKSPNRVCLTFDCWTSITSQGCLCLTAHFVDEKWKLNSKMLTFSKMDFPHSGVELAERVHDMLIDWGIDQKIFSITLDNASTDDNMQNILKDRLNLSNSLICNGEFFHVRSCARIFDLIVQEGLKVTSDALHKIRESVRYVRQSEARMTNFKRCIDQVGGIDTSEGLRLDVPTRWNSTHTMLESALKYRRAFAYLALEDDHYHHCLTNEEWSRVDEMCTFLKPFDKIIKLISGSSYPPSNVYFMLITEIGSKLKKCVHNDDPAVRDMAVRMLDEFDKYWSDYNVILVLAIILDPRMKFDFIKYSYSKLDPINCNEKTESIRSKLYNVFSEYKDVVSSSSSWVSFIGGESSSNINGSKTFPPISTHYSLTDEDIDFTDFYDFIEHKSKDTTTMNKSELDFYLEERTLDPWRFAELNVLDYWKTNSDRFPCLSKMACDILSIPNTTVASESTFSIGSRALTKYRNCLLPENVQALACSRNWILGFPCSEESEEKESIDVLTASHTASNFIIEDD